MLDLDMDKLEAAVDAAVARLARITPLKTEADMIRALRGGGTFTLPQLYRVAERVGLADRPGGRKRIQDGREQYKRRVRSALYAAHRCGWAPRAGGAWLIEGSTERPTRALFVWLPNDTAQVELVLGRASEVLARCGEPIDLVVADPPWALDRDDPRAAYRRVYGRNHAQVVPGYVEVDTAEYADFTASWVQAARDAIRPGGYLAVITGAQQAARAQIAAEDAGLTYVNSIVWKRQFGLYTTRQYVHQHHTITLLTNGPLDSRHRTFHRPEEMPRGRSGEIYAVDVWDDIAEERRRKLLRYNNALPWQLLSRLIRSTTDPDDLVVDPFVGSGTTPIACLHDGRRFFGGDANPNALRFTMARILAEVIPALEAARPTT